MAFQTQALPQSNDLKGTWDFLQDGIDAFMTRLTEGMTHDRYMQLYTVAYNYCTSARMATTASDTLSGPSVGGRSGANLMGSDLYKKLTTYFADHLKATRSTADTLADEALLKFYASEWDRYTGGAHYVHRLFRYLNRHWVKREKEEGRRNVYVVFTLALVQWRENMHKHVQINSKLANAVFTQIRKHREGEVVNISLLKKVIDSFVSLGLDETDYNRQNLEIYRSEFEMPFISATEVFYKAESETFLAQNSMSDYLKKAEARLKEEEDRVEMYLHPSSRNRLIGTCERVLIAGHKQQLLDEFINFLVNKKSEDLSRMYKIMARIPDKDGLAPLRIQFQDHVLADGKDTLASIAAAEKGPDPADYVKALLDVYERNRQVIFTSLLGETGFHGALDKACSSFFNKNDVTGYDQASDAKAVKMSSAELLARYSDAVLKKGNKDAEDGNVEEALKSIMTVFKFLTDKDIFSKFYKQFLSKRLIGFTSASDDNESSMITKMKEVEGTDYVKSLQSMFTDMGTSKDINESFRTHLAQEQGADHDKNTIDLHVLTLSTQVWPFSASSNNPSFIIPAELQNLYKRFERFYEHRHSGRKLDWIWRESRFDLRVGYLKQKYTFSTSTYQAAVLLQFNNATEYSDADLIAATGIPKEQFGSAIVPLIKSRVLNKEGDVNKLNTAYNGKKLRINLNVSVGERRKEESVEVLKTINEDRKHMTQAAIVRIMKSRKQMKHAQLIQETVVQVQRRFQPKIPDIKKEIDTLIEKEYLERVEGQKDVYAYMA